MILNSIFYLALSISALFTDLSNKKILELPYNRSISVGWKISEGEIEFSVTSQTAGYVAIGFSDAGGMKGALIYVGRMLSGGFVVETKYAETYSTPQDSRNSAVLLEGRQDLHGTYFRFKVKLCEEMAISLTKPIWMIYAIGKSNSFTYHSIKNRGQALVDLTGKYFDDGPSLRDENTFHVDLVSPAVELTSEKTAYCYSFFDLSKLLNGKSHIIAEDMRIGTELLHHSVAYLCTAPEKKLSHGKVLCNYYRDHGEPDVTNYELCSSRVYLGWGKGGKSRVYPSRFGKPLGQDKFQYLVLENHYNNPDRLPKQVDSGSGFRLTMTKNLREVDIGMLTLGIDQERLLIPPNGIHSMISECGKKCSLVGIPDTGITILSSLLHMVCYS
jgi:hypothetical protein